ncbi:protein DETOXIFICATION [Trifolium repens]|nr:protein DETOXIFICATION [Trifolium repens]
MEWQHWGVIDCMEFAIYPFHFEISFAFWGVLAGCGWQKIGAYVNLGSFYVIGVPCAIVLAFFVHMHAMTLLYIIFTILSNWEEHARKAQSRVERSTTTSAPTTTNSDRDGVLQS